MMIAMSNPQPSTLNPQPSTLTLGKSMITMFPIMTLRWHQYFEIAYYGCKAIRVRVTVTVTVRVRVIRIHILRSALYGV